MSIDLLTYPTSRDEFFNEYISFRQFHINNFEKVIEQGCYKDISKDELIEAVDMISSEYKQFLAKAPSMTEYFYGNAVKYCINRFLDSEMDYVTPGDRGMGRITTFIPRFAGMYANILNGLSINEQNIIRNAIFKILKLGYKTAVFFEIVIERDPSKLDYIDSLDLFKRWIPKIYGTDLTLDDTGNRFISQSRRDGLIYFCFSIANETSFPPQELFLYKAIRSKLMLIIGKYIEAGFWLRILETKLMK